MARFAAIGLDHRHVYDLTAGLLAEGLKLPLTLVQVGVDFRLMGQVKGNGPVNLFQGEGGKRLSDTFRRGAAQEGVNNRIERNTGAADSIGPLPLLHVLFGHFNPPTGLNIIIAGSDTNTAILRSCAAFHFVCAKTNIQTRLGNPVTRVPSPIPKAPSPRDELLCGTFPAPGNEPVVSSV